MYSFDDLPDQHVNVIRVDERLDTHRGSHRAEIQSKKTIKECNTNLWQIFLTNNQIADLQILQSDCCDNLRFCLIKISWMVAGNRRAV